MNMTRKAVGKTNRILSGYCLVVAESAEGKIKLFGSPAEQASVDAGDEILEVNGRKLDESSHNDVIDHIHQSIKSRRVSLKVRRRKGKRLVDEFPTYSIQNAYIVSSDDQAHQHVDLLPHNNGPIHPVDMCTLLSDPRQDEEINIPDATLNIGISLKPVTSQSVSPVESLRGEAESPPPEAEFIRPLSAPEQNRSIEDLLQRTLRNIDTCIQLSKKQEGSHFDRCHPRKFPGQFKESSADFSYQFLQNRRPVNFCPGLLASEETSRISSSMPSSDSAVDMGTQIQYNLGREMAIDVPEEFTGTIKRPLRYPTANDGSPDLYSPSAAMQEAERIKRYQAEIRKRTEEEQLKAKKDEFLRTSLRNSTRLKALEKKSRLPPPPGFFNAAFEDERAGQDDFPVALSDSSHGMDIIDVPDSQSMKEALEQIAAVLKRENSEFADELDFIESLFDNAVFRSAADLHHLIESRQLALTEPVTTQAESLVDTVKRLLPGSLLNKDAQELEAILSTPQFENLIAAHDSVAVQTVELAQLQPSPVQDTKSNGCLRTDGNSSFHSDAPTESVGEHQVVQAMPSYSSSTQSNFPGNDVRTVRIEKHPDTPLGATIRIDDDNGSVVVARIVHGGAAQKSGLLHEGDELIEVNGIDLRGKSLEEVCERLAAMKGALIFTVLPAQQYSEMPVRQNDLHVRANFSYDSDDDPYAEALQCPCAGLGLSFQKRDILHIRNQDDARWWQAYRDGEELGSVLAGLIPSSEQQERRHEYSLRTTVNGPRINGKLVKRDGKKRIGFRKSDKSGKKKRIVSGSPFVAGAASPGAPGSIGGCCPKMICCCWKTRARFETAAAFPAVVDLDGGRVPWYEEVGLLNPKPHQKRPIVLIGPFSQKGRIELLERVVASDVDRFAKAISHTTRPKRKDEVDGRDHHFVSKHVFDGEILKQRFVEWGTYEKHSYGTTLESINLVIKSGKVCILSLEPSAIRSLRAANFKPYVVFIAPPPLDKLQQNRLRMGLPADEISARRIIEEAEDIEENSGHYIDLVIENVDDNSTYAQLLTEINRLERDAQWVPAEWLRQ